MEDEGRGGEYGSEDNKSDAVAEEHENDVELEHEAERVPSYAIPGLGLGWRGRDGGGGDGDCVPTSSIWSDNRNERSIPPRGEYAPITDDTSERFWHETGVICVRITAIAIEVAFPHSKMKTKHNPEAIDRIQNIHLEGLKIVNE